MESAIDNTVPVQGKRPKPIFKAYQFVATSVVQSASLRLEIDCRDDMEASVMAFSFVSKEHAVEVWSDGALIYQAPATGQH